MQEPSWPGDGHGESLETRGTEEKLAGHPMGSPRRGQDGNGAADAALPPEDTANRSTEEQTEGDEEKENLPHLRHPTLVRGETVEDASVVGRVREPLASSDPSREAARQSKREQWEAELHKELELQRSEKRKRMSRYEARLRTSNPSRDQLSLEGLVPVMQRSSDQLQRSRESCAETLRKERLSIATVMEA